MLERVKGGRAPGCRPQGWGRVVVVVVVVCVHVWWEVVQPGHNPIYSTRVLQAPPPADRADGLLVPHLVLAEVGLLRSVHWATGGSGVVTLQCVSSTSLEDSTHDSTSWPPTSSPWTTGRAPLSTCL
jgi:hypothetical protein